MTVRELIAKLETMNPNGLIEIHYPCYDEGECDACGEYEDAANIFDVEASGSNIIFTRLSYKKTAEDIQKEVQKEYDELYKLAYEEHCNPLTKIRARMKLKGMRK